MRPSVQPHVEPSEIASTSEARASDIRPTPTKSGVFGSVSPTDSVSTRRPKSSTNRPIGMLTKNAHRQPPADTIAAPSDGPVATASAPMPPHWATICMRRSGG